MRRVPLEVINNSSSGKLKTLIVDTTDKIEKPFVCLSAVPIRFIVYLGQTIAYEKNPNYIMKQMKI